MKQAFHITQDSFRYLFKKYYQPLCAFARQFVSVRDVCEDTVQDAFASLWDVRGGFKEEKAVKYYLYNSVRNKCLNVIRHNKVKEKHLNELALPTVDEGVIEEGVFAPIYKALLDLSPQECKVMLGVMHGHTNQDIADDLGVSINTVKTLRQRAYKTLREKLKGIQWLLLILFG
ncbi:MAG: sigma-70 family RNA polymerase sigma factor [Bacteroidales bacterium]|nr:sigma-70 family RNA polymerase sigma factor [Bacteroidales bacterium]